LQVVAGQEIMLISSTGTLVRTPVDEISVLGRNTQGVRLIRLAEGERLTGIERIEHLEGEVVVDEAGDAPPGDTPSTDTPASDATPEGAPESEN
jgi:DNA gyrase subunit A